MRFLLFWLAWVSVLSAAGVREGMSREEVEAVLGRPRSVLESKGRQVLLYADGGRVELAEGKLVQAVKVPMDFGQAEAVPAPVVPVTAPVAEPPKPAAVAAASTEPVTAGGELAVYDQSAHQRLLEKSIDDLSRVHEDKGTVPAPDPMGFWAELALSSLAQLLASVVVLKFAFAWVEVDAEWGQMWVPALAEMAATVAVRIGAYFAWGATQLFQMDNGVAFAVLIVVLMKTTHACTWRRAAAVAMTTKVAGIGVRLLFGAFAAHALD